MLTGLSIEILGLVRRGQFSPYPLQPRSYFTADRVAIGSRAWSFPALVLPDSTVSPRHALVVKEGQGWVIQDMDSDNGIRVLPSFPKSDLHLEAAKQAIRFEFDREICCCIGAVVLRLIAFPSPERASTIGSSESTPADE